MASTSAARTPAHHGAFHAFERIVVPVQGTDAELVAQVWAVQLAADMRIPLLAVHVGDEADGEANEREGRERFGYLAKECSEWDVPFELRILRGGRVADEIVEELRPRDLVVIGTRRLAHEYHLGSVAHELIRRAPCPVQVVRIE